MTHKITIMALIAGIVLGAAATEGFTVYRQSQDSYRRSHDSQSFQQRVHCKTVADAYVKENTDFDENAVTGRSVTLDKVDYSPARNSCVAELETTTYLKRGALLSQSVQDLLSGETLFSVTNSTVNPIENFDGMVQVFLPRVWDHVMSKASEPLELEKEWALIESKSPPKATSPAVMEWDAQGNPIASAPPSVQIDPAMGERIQAPTSQHKSPP